MEDVNKAQIYVNIDAFRWHTLIFTISWFAEHRIIAPVCTGTSSVATNEWPALHNQCLFSECKSSLQLVLVKRMLYFSASTTGSLYIYIYTYMNPIAVINVLAGGFKRSQWFRTLSAIIGWRLPGQIGSHSPISHSTNQPLRRNDKMLMVFFRPGCSKYNQLVYSNRCIYMAHH